MSLPNDLKTTLGIENHEEWQIHFCIFMSQYASLGNNGTLGELLAKPVDDPWYNGIAARTWRAAMDVGDRIGYMRCLKELVGE